MRKTAAAVTAILMLFVGLRYSWLTWQGEIQPMLTTWLLFYVALLLSFWTYWSSEKHSIIGNINNAVDLVVVGIILSTIIFFGKNVRLGFNSFEVWCLIASGVILVFWWISKMHKTSNLALQGIMVVAYFPTLYQLWQAPGNTESLETWIAGWFASASALIPAFIDKDKLAVVYASRALLMTSVVIGLMLRLEVH